MRSLVLTTILIGCLGTFTTATSQHPQQHQLQTLRKFDPAYRLPDSVGVHADLVFASPGGRDLHLDLFTPPPTTRPSPAVLFIQGSGYNGNNKVHFWREAAALARRGFVAVTIEHRGLGPDRAVWPAQLDDCEAALRWMATNASQYGIDVTRVAVVGASSGAHLAALAGSGRRKLDDRPAIRAVVLISGLLDTVYFGQNRVWSTDYGMWIDLAPLFSTSYAENPAVWLDASPTSHLRANGPRTLIVHGTADATLPIEQARRYYDAAVAAGMPVEFVSIDGGGHEMTNAFAYSEVFGRISTFLGNALK